MTGPCLMLLALLVCTTQAAAQRRVTAWGLATGAAFGDQTRPTAGFGASLMFQLGPAWLLTAHRTVADYSADEAGGTQRDVAVSLLPVWEPLAGRIFAGAGISLHALHIDRINGVHQRRTEPGATVMAGVRLPIGGAGVALELAARGDVFAGQRQMSAWLGIRVRPGQPTTLQLGEPSSTPRAAARAAAWNDVLMQLILLQQDLEAFSRIREIELGIELEFELGAVTLYDDVAKVARVLAAADPPVTINIFAPNAGRAAAAVAAGSFPPERVHMNRSDRLFLRVEH